MKDENRPAYWLGEKNSIQHNKQSWYYVRNDEKKRLDFILYAMWYVHTKLKDKEGYEGIRSVSIKKFYNIIKKQDPEMYGKTKLSRYTGKLSPMDKASMIKYIIMLRDFINMQGISPEEDTTYGAKMISLTKEGWLYCEKVLGLELEKIEEI